MDKRVKNDWYYDSDSSTSIPEERSHIEWKDKIDPEGNLFFVKYNSISRTQITNDNTNNDLSGKTSTGIIGRLIRRRNSRRSARKPETRETEERDENVIEAGVASTTDLLLINVQKASEILPNLGRRATPTEQHLGLKVITENNQVVVIGFLEIPAFQFSPKILSGDILISVNGSPVNAQNLDNVVLKNALSKEVILGVKRTIKEDSHVYDSIKYPSLKIQKDESISYKNMGLLYTKVDGVSKDDTEEGLIYLYPKQNNVLFPIKGIFLTLYHLLSLITTSPPISTKISINKQIVNVTYTAEKDELLLIGLPEKRFTVVETLRITQEIVQYKKFTFQSLSRCFQKTHFGFKIDIFLQMFFKQIKEELNESINNRQFETILMAASTLPVPKDIYVQVDDALNELESNDILSEENERLFSIIGSCYICKGHVICNHLCKDDLLEVTTIFRQSGLLKLSEEGVKELIYWREVFPLAYNRGFSSYSQASYSVPTGRWFLLVVAQQNEFLATLLEAGGCTIRLAENQGPDSNLIEEAQATLEHIISLEIPPLVHKWLRKSVDENSASKGHLQRIESSNTLRQSVSYSELTTKRLSNYYEDGERINSESSLPVLGRRAEREMANEISLQSRMSTSDISDDSDWMKDGKQTDHSSDISDFSKGTLRDIGYTPRPVGSIESLFHYVNLDRAEGILISSSGTNIKPSQYNNVMNNFRHYSHKIQRLFMNTIAFKKLKSKDLHQFTWNKSLVAVKEYGILFNCADSTEKSTSHTYWVVGRLFCTPKLREIYVCYQDLCPQNVTELAFQLALSSSHL